jgi:hypothetical protein
VKMPHPPFANGLQLYKTAGGGILYMYLGIVSRGDFSPCVCFMILCQPRLLFSLFPVSVFSHLPFNFDLTRLSD